MKIRENYLIADTTFKQSDGVLSPHKMFFLTRKQPQVFGHIDRYE
jgi:hypothetical protein